MTENATPSMRDVYPDLSEKELAEAEDNLDRYLALVLRIFERTETEMDPQAGRLTDGDGTVGSSSPQRSG
jgi:hypothetical protein